MTRSKYTTTQGDTWDIISFKLYNHEHFISELIKANPTYRNTIIFPANVELNVPEISMQPISVLPPWKRGGNT